MNSEYKTGATPSTDGISRKEEMYLAVEVWQESGLTQKDFCQKEELSLATFGYWLQKYRLEHKEEQPVSTSSGFVPIEVQSSAAVSFELKIEYSNGVQLHPPLA